MNTAPKLPALIAGRYQPVRLIAKGGMGAVYEVEHARTGERLALKVLLSGVGASPEDLERFKREARASARIKSEHVVRVTDADVSPELDGALFLVMELLEGMDLERKATAERPDATTVVDWLRQVATAIDKAHRIGIVHRDLKPENLFLTTLEDRPPIIKVLDFGISKLAEDGTGATGSGQIIGTPRYMAPEQASSGARVGPPTDRFALGLVAYRLLAGESYFKGDPINILAQILHEPLRAPSERHPEIGGAFDVWFARACHRNPDDRFASAAEQVEALSAALGLPTAATPAAVRKPSGRAPTTEKVARRTAAPIALAVGALLIGGAIAGVLAMRRPGPVEPPAEAASSLPSPSPAAAPTPAPPPIAPAATNLAVTRPTSPASVAAAPPVVAPATALEASRPRAKTHSAKAHPMKADSLPVTTERHPAKASLTTDPYADQK
jgi:serine/threonine protein kinase